MGQVLANLAIHRYAAAVDHDLHDQVEQLCRQILAPLIVVDGGEMYLGTVSADSVLIHLAGSCSGCPGSSLTAERIISPALQSVVPRANIVVTTGFLVPEGWTKVS